MLNSAGDVEDIRYGQEASEDSRTPFHCLGLFSPKSLVQGGKGPT